MLYREFHDWLSNHFKGCKDHGTVQPEYVLRVLTDLIEADEKAKSDNVAPSSAPPADPS